MYDRLFFAQNAYRDYILKHTGGLKQEDNFPLTTEQKYIYYGTNRQTPLSKTRWYKPKPRRQVPLPLGYGRPQPQIWTRKTGDDRCQTSPLGEDWRPLK